MVLLLLLFALLPPERERKGELLCWKEAFNPTPPSQPPSSSSAMIDSRFCSRVDKLSSTTPASSPWLKDEAKLSDMALLLGKNPYRFINIPSTFSLSRAISLDCTLKSSFSVATAAMHSLFVIPSIDLLCSVCVSAKDCNFLIALNRLLRSLSNPVLNCCANAASSSRKSVFWRTTSVETSVNRVFISFMRYSICAILDDKLDSMITTSCRRSVNRLLIISMQKFSIL
mmetsp:Transcript_6583/g.11048  ORF Transcript_6583/g.11048 Transcript_6583/m.11048 type:complete len:228 (-) Transcript_6583:127-810(-)